MYILDMMDKNGHQLRILFPLRDIEDAYKALYSARNDGLRARLIHTSMTDRKKIKEYVDSLPW